MLCKRWKSVGDSCVQNSHAVFAWSGLYTIVIFLCIKELSNFSLHWTFSFPFESVDDVMLNFIGSDVMKKMRLLSGLLLILNFLLYRREVATQQICRCITCGENTGYNGIRQSWN